MCYVARRKFNKLKTLMYELDVTQDDLVPVIGKSSAYISLRLTARKPFNTDEIQQIAAFLGIPREEWLDYFIEPVIGPAKAVRV